MHGRNTRRKNTRRRNIRRRNTRRKNTRRKKINDEIKIGGAPLSDSILKLLVLYIAMLLTVSGVPIKEDNLKSLTRGVQQGLGENVEESAEAILVYGDIDPKDPNNEEILREAETAIVEVNTDSSVQSQVDSALTEHFSDQIVDPSLLVTGASAPGAPSPGVRTTHRY